MAPISDATCLEDGWDVDGGGLVFLRDGHFFDGGGAENALSFMGSN